MYAEVVINFALSVQWVMINNHAVLVELLILKMEQDVMKQ